MTKSGGSEKTLIIETLFNDPKRWKGGVLASPVVTLSDVQDAIVNYNKGNPKSSKPLNANNPANFFKDFIRRQASANANWPESVLKKGYTAIQKTGTGNCFEFVKLPPGQTTAFSVTGAVYPKNPATTILAVAQTLSLERMTKALARKDENWLQSISVSMHIPQAHLALHHDQLLPWSQVGHMQSNMKLRKTEIDGLYYGYLSNGKVALITMEVKGDSDDILETQIYEQIEAVQNMPSINDLMATMSTTAQNTIVLPMALKIVKSSCANALPNSGGIQVIGERLLYVAHYHPVGLTAGKPTSLTIKGETLFDLRPSIPGIT